MVSSNSGLLQRGRALLTPACFFLVSVSYKLAWTTISSLLSQYSRDYGPEVLLQLNIAYFLPSIPILMLQATLNDSMDRRLGSTARGASLRFIIGLGALVLLTGSFPAVASSHARLLAATTCVGVAYGIAFGTSYQLASRFPPINTVMLTTGFVSSGPVVLLLDLVIKRGTYYTDAGLTQLFSAVAVLTSMGLKAALVLVWTNSKQLAAGAQPQHVDISKLSSRKSGSIKAHRSTKAYGSSSSTSVPAVRHRDGVGSGDGSWANHNGHNSHYAYQQQYPHHEANGSDQQHHAVMMMDSVLSGSGGSLNGITPPPSWQQQTGAPGKDADGTGKAGAGSWLASQSSYDSTQGDGVGEKDKQLLVSYHTGADRDDSNSKRRKPDMPLMSVALRISPAALSICLSVGTSMLVFPFFTYMTSTGLMGERLAQVLFYVRLVGDILGRLVPRRLQATSVPRLMFWALVKTAMVPVLFMCIFRPHLTGGDLGATLVVGLFWVLSGYVNTCAYLVAPTLVPPAAKPRASGLMTVAFQSSCLLALLGAAAIQQLGKT